MAASFRQAFSVRLNLAKLTGRAPGRLSALDGMRALAIFWTVLFHALWYVGRVLPPETYFGVLYDPDLLLLWRGHFGVDAFFVLSGFLIAGMLIDERERTGRIAVGLFYVRRLFRLWPALFAAVVIDALVIGLHPQMLWANLLYVSNFFPVLDSAMSWTWSLSIEEQFYLVCPMLVLALATRSSSIRIGAVIALALVFVAIGAGVIVHGGFHATDSEIALDRDIPSWARAFDQLYSKPWMRAGPLFAGVLAAFVYRSPGAMKALSSARVLSTVGLVLALVLGWISTEWRLVVFAPRPLEVFYLAAYRTMFGACVAYVVLLALSKHPVGRGLAYVLSLRVLYPIATLAYTAYLVNPIATMVSNQLVAPWVLESGLPILAVLIAVNLAATFALALVLHLALERPFMELRPG